MAQRAQKRVAFQALEQVEIFVVHLNDWNNMWDNWDVMATEKMSRRASVREVQS